MVELQSVELQKLSPPLPNTSLPSSLESSLPWFKCVNPGQSITFCAVCSSWLPVNYFPLMLGWTTSSPSGTRYSSHYLAVADGSLTPATSWGSRVTYPFFASNLCESFHANLAMLHLVLKSCFPIVPEVVTSGKAFLYPYVLMRVLKNYSRNKRRFPDGGIFYA